MYTRYEHHFSDEVQKPDWDLLKELLNLVDRMQDDDSCATFMSLMMFRPLFKSAVAFGSAIRWRSMMILAALVVFPHLSEVQTFCQHVTLPAPISSSAAADLRELAPFFTHESNIAAARKDHVARTAFLDKLLSLL